MTMAFYYQEFILGLAAPQTPPMMEVVVALDLSGEGAVSDYKKLLQGLIWKERATRAISPASCSPTGC